MFRDASVLFTLALLPGVLTRWKPDPEADYSPDVFGDWHLDKKAFLTPKERERWQQYHEKFPGRACNLAQNVIVEAGGRPQISRGQDGLALFTLTKTQGLVMMPLSRYPEGRWLIPQELWLSMGFPAVEEVIQATGGAKCCFAPGEPVPGRRSSHTQREQSGNSMHVNSIGAVVLTMMLTLGMGTRVANEEMESFTPATSASTPTSASIESTPTSYVTSTSSGSDITDAPSSSSRFANDFNLAFQNIKRRRI